MKYSACNAFSARRWAGNRLFFILLSLVVSLAPALPVVGQELIPAPLSVQPRPGVFCWTAQTVVGLDVESQEAEAWREYLEPLVGGSPLVRGVVPQGRDRVDLRLCRQDTLLARPGSYRLSVGQARIEVCASSGEGLFYGFQTLRQLMVRNAQGSGWQVAATEIYDAPRFSYRGCMIDVSRHFFPPSFLKKQIALLSLFKINTLHLHLTDGGGWRLEIKKYPRLTALGAWRAAGSWQQWWGQDRHYLSADAPGAYGGYYTQEEMRDIVAYAARHHITLIPEIEMPAHTEEVLAAYPELSCSGKAYCNSAFCVGEEKTFRFLEDVLTEVMEIFPSKYIHIGGDEADKRAWSHCPKCQKRMEQEGLPDVDALQSYLIKRVERFLNAHGRHIIGWDEILEGGLAPHATVMSWRGEEGGIAAARLGRPVVMTPGWYCYLDAYQDAPYTQPEANSRYLPLYKVYAYDPVPAVLSAKERACIIGVQGNLWTEFVPDAHHAEYMLYPRMLALAEVGWTEPTRKSWDSFRHRLPAALALLRQHGIHYFDPAEEVGPRPQSKQPMLHLAMGKKVTYHAPYSSGHPASGNTALTDGRCGDWIYGDQVWQGFVGERGMDVTIDLEQETAICGISADFLQVAQAEVFLPRMARISISSDNVHYTLLHEQKRSVKGSDEMVHFVTVAWRGEAVARYIRFEALQDPQLKGFLFTDEIVVK